jgi:hypothetical protein
LRPAIDNNGGALLCTPSDVTTNDGNVIATVTFGRHLAVSD